MVVFHLRMGQFEFKWVTYIPQIVSNHQSEFAHDTKETATSQSHALYYSNKCITTGRGRACYRKPAFTESAKNYLVLPSPNCTAPAAIRFPVSKRIAAGAVHLDFETKPDHTAKCGVNLIFCLCFIDFLVYTQGCAIFLCSALKDQHIESMSTSSSQWRVAQKLSWLWRTQCLDWYMYKYFLNKKKYIYIYVPCLWHFVTNICPNLFQLHIVGNLFVSRPQALQHERHEDMNWISCAAWAIYERNFKHLALHTAMPFFLGIAIIFLKSHVKSA